MYYGPPEGSVKNDTNLGYGSNMQFQEWEGTGVAIKLLNEKWHDAHQALTTVKAQ